MFEMRTLEEDVYKAARVLFPNHYIKFGPPFPHGDYSVGTFYWDDYEVDFVEVGQAVYIVDCRIKEDD
jgi:hypothetical protein